jgi:predicted phosphodiesterase
VHDIKRLGGDPASEGIDVVISGHSHRPSVERRARLLLLNPGSAGPRRFTLPVAVARLHVGPAGLRAEIVELGAPRPPAR